MLGQLLEAHETFIHSRLLYHKHEVVSTSNQLGVRKGVPGILQLQNPRAKPQGTELNLQNNRIIYGIYVI